VFGLVESKKKSGVHDFVHTVSTQLCMDSYISCNLPAFLAILPNIMRTCLSFLLAAILSLNAAYAASVGVCDVLEHTSSHAAHLGHHSHDHGDEHAHNDPSGSADGTGNVPATADHHHTHVHPSFSYLLPDTIGMTSSEGCTLLNADPADTFVSAQQALLDRPPRAALA